MQSFGADPWCLTWADVAPAAHPFDPATVPGTVPYRAGDDRDWHRDITHAFVDRYGVWACGWSALTTNTPEGVGLPGGPRDFWDADPDTVRRGVVGSLLGWRAWLEELAVVFAEFRLPSDDPEVRARRWEQVVVRLIAMAVERVAEDEYWHYSCEQVLSWCLSASGVPDERAQDLVTAATEGRFSSWVRSSESNAAEVARAVATELSGA
ncbi:hypothetical protein OG948_46490 (plasmid) [Embleya sp. NBC_00888]|uniref:hypothetical protein n=1 Tax=Embleya sp. NBC_00888 TaxID=2975960 RepID=UPI002F90C2BB|nr:hypothetical protein OG948_46490 [Embleya sp. NBC_00888]